MSKADTRRFRIQYFAAAHFDALKDVGASCQISEAGSMPVGHDSWTKLQGRDARGWQRLQRL
eukprot:6186605-Pleurochrysis_carterae.AAC.3